MHNTLQDCWLLINHFANSRTQRLSPHWDVQNGTIIWEASLFLAFSQNIFLFVYFTECIFHYIHFFNAHFIKANNQIVILWCVVVIFFFLLSFWVIQAYRIF
jgi:hypothetical protein